VYTTVQTPIEPAVINAANAKLGSHSFSSETEPQVKQVFPYVLHCQQGLVFVSSPLLPSLAVKEGIIARTKASSKNRAVVFKQYLFRPVKGMCVIARKQRHVVSGV